MSAAGVSLDTSVLLRLLVAQPVDQFRVAIGFLQAQRANHVPVHVGDLVLAEGYFALLSFYRFSKPDALAALSQFVEHSGVTVSPAARDSLALPGLATAQRASSIGSSTVPPISPATRSSASRKLPKNSLRHSCSRPLIEPP